jgi:hypothetical protein
MISLSQQYAIADLICLIAIPAQIYTYTSVAGHYARSSVTGLELLNYQDLWLTYIIVGNNWHIS